MGTIVIKDKKGNIITSSISGNNISILGGKIIVNGTDITPDSKQINIEVTGNLDYLTVDVCDGININGNVGTVKSGTADVVCDDITGNVQTGSGDVDANNIGGDVQTGSGDVDAAAIAGSVRTGSGDIKYRK